MHDLIIDVQPSPASQHPTKTLLSTPLDSSAEKEANSRSENGVSVFTSYLCQRENDTKHSFSSGDDAAPSTNGSQDNDSSKEDEKDKWIWVLDPLTRKLRVPLSLLVPTQATAAVGTVPSLCIAFLEGRCRHPWCRQAHVQPSAIPQLRYEALHAPTCCHIHHDPHDISRLTNHFKYIRIVNNGNSGDSELIPTDRVACTVGLLRYLVQIDSSKRGESEGNKYTVRNLNASNTTTNNNTPHINHTVLKQADAPFLSPDISKESVLELPAKFICRLHLAHRCRYLEDCNNIHICRDYEFHLQPPPHVMSTLGTVHASMRTIMIGDIVYNIHPLATGEVTEKEFKAISEKQKARHIEEQGSQTNRPLRIYDARARHNNNNNNNNSLATSTPFSTASHNHNTPHLQAH